MYSNGNSFGMATDPCAGVPVSIVERIMTPWGGRGDARPV